MAIPIDIDAVAKILSVVVTAGLAIWKTVADGKPRLVTFYGHRSETQVRDAPAVNGAAPQPPFDVYTHSVVIANIGKKTAFDIRIGHIHMPNSFTVMPRSTPYKVEVNAEGFTELLIPTMVAKEEVTISYLYLPPIQWSRINSYVKHDAGWAKAIEPLRYEPPSKLRLGLVIVLSAIGAMTTFYWLIRAGYTLVSAM